MSIRRALQVSGFIWLLIGFMLLRKGLFFASSLAAASQEVTSSKLFEWLLTLSSSSVSAAAIIVFAGVLIGFAKARAVLSKVVDRNVQRLKDLKNPQWRQLFDKKFIVLIVAMMTLGISINVFGLPCDLRAFIDVAVGSALIQGSSIYFRVSRTVV